VLYNQPFDQPNSPSAPYVDGNPASGTPGSIPRGAAIEYPQREIVEVIRWAWQDKAFPGCLAPSNGDLTQLRKVFQGIFLSQKTVLTEATTFYVNASSGNDSTGNGTAGAPWQTLQHAYSAVLAAYASAGVVITFQCTGAFTGSLSVSAPISGAVGAASTVFDFMAGASITVSNTSCIGASNCGVMIDGDVALSATGSGVCCGLITGIGACSSGHVYTDAPGSFIGLSGSYTINGAAPYHLISFGGYIAGGPCTVTLTGAPNFSNAFVSAVSLGSIYYGAVTFSGSATGVRYQGGTNALINTSGGGANFFPGNSPGDVANGAVYV
jgi:hypothetical protein